MVAVFAVPVFFICFRECLETSIIVSVLLAFLKRTLGPDQDPVVYKKLVKQIWWGVALGLFICIAIGAGMIGAFYGAGKNAFAGTENIWEGVFSIIATLIISLMGAALLRVSKLQDKWRVKLARAIELKDATGGLSRGRFKRWAEKYVMFLLPFITVLREGLEAVIFIGGVGLGMPATAFPLAVVCGLAAGCLVGYLIYRGGNYASLQIFLIISTCFLYLVAAGLFSRGVWLLESDTWNHIVGGDASEVGSGPGSYDIRKSVWHVNVGLHRDFPRRNRMLTIVSVFGWTNSATYGSVLSYNLYWLSVIIAFVAMAYKEKKGHWPFRKSNKTAEEPNNQASDQPGGVVLNDSLAVKQKEAEGVQMNIRETPE